MTSDDARISEIRRRHQEGPFGECETCDVLARFEALASQQQERLDALAAEREEIDAAVRELHEAALEKLEGRVTYWMGQRDKFCDQLADEKKSHARTQEWLDKFQSEAATQQVRAIMAEQALTKAEAERDAAVARAERAEAARDHALKVISSTIEAVTPEPCRCAPDEFCAECLPIKTLEAALAAASEGERAVIFLRNDDGSISVDGGEFAQEADFDVYLLGKAGELLQTTIRLTTREGTAVYMVDGAQPLGAPSLHARLVRVEGAGE